MRLVEKLPRIKVEVDGLAYHRDEAGAVRIAALEAAKRHIDDRIAEIEAETAAATAVFG